MNWPLFRLIILSLILNLALVPVQAKRFTNKYCEFELPGGWECALEGTEWVCQAVNDDRKKEAIIILAAKIRGSQDSLDQYQSYLKQTKTFSLPGGRTQVSESKFINLKTINDHRWVDALHLASEVPGFYTRYLATVKEDLGVAVTFSVAKDHYSSYQTLFDKIVESLRVFRQKSTDTGDFALKKKEEDLLGDDTTFIPSETDKVDIGQRKRKGGGLGDLVTSNLIYILGAVAVIVVLIKLKSKKKKKKKKKNSEE